MPASALGSWAKLVWEELKSRNLDAHAIFKQSGIDPAKLSNPTARFPAQNMVSLWVNADAAASDPGFAVAAGKRWNPTTFHALGFAWLASSSLAGAFNRLVRYGRFVNDGLEYQLTSDGVVYRFRITAKQEDSEFFNQIQKGSPGSDAGIVAILKMVRMLVGESFSPLEINRVQEPNAASLPLEQFVRCPIHYGKGYGELVIARQDMEQKLSSGNEELSQMNEQILLKHLSQLDREQLSTRVKLEILQQLPSGNVKESDIAESIGLSSRTMQRRLLDEGVNFSSLLQDTRQQLASQYIKDDQLSISEIAYLLGFSDQANFTRAFKRWNGVSPTQYRNQETALN